MEAQEPRGGMTPVGFWLKYWFLFGLASAIGLAAAYPPLAETVQSKYTVTYGVVCLIFFLSGISLKSKVLASAALDWKIHLLVQLISLGITPLVGLGVSRLLLVSDTFDVNLAVGLVVAIATPTTISSNVLMTKQCGGNEGAALVNAVIGNVLGVFVSPSLIFAFVRQVTPNARYGQIDYSKVFLNLFVTVVGPLFLGQAIQFAFPITSAKVTATRNPSLSIINSCLLLVLVWSVMCETFSSSAFSTVNGSSLVAIIFIDLGLFVLFSAMAFWAARLLKFGKKDTVAIVMCGATKTVALGIPMINVIFAGSKDIGIISLPLLLYHSEQLIVGSAYVQLFTRWIKSDDDEGGMHGEDVDLSMMDVVSAPLDQENGVSRQSIEHIQDESNK